MILSRAHDWVGNHSLVCTRCGIRTTPGEWDVPRCRAHWQSDTSGYKDESEQFLRMTDAEVMALSPAQIAAGMAYFENLPEGALKERRRTEYERVIESRKSA